MKYFNHISKTVLIVVAIAGLAIGMSSVTGLSDNSSKTISPENSIMDSNCGSGKCGGNDTEDTTTEAKCGGDEAKAAVSDKVDEAKASVKDAKCGEGKCGQGKCGGDNTVAKSSNFMGIDANEDGKVSKTEFANYGTKEFPNKDSNNDGKLTSDECMMFDSFNADGNGYLSKTEFEAGHNKMFSKMDGNSDGFIDGNEAKSMHKSNSSKCGEGKCGGDEAKAAVSDKVDEAKTSVKEEAKCGAGKCG